MEVDGYEEIRKLCLFCDVPKIENENSSLDDYSKQSEEEEEVGENGHIKGGY